jgi:aminopeptidase
MTIHPRQIFASIDNVKLDKLAELAVRVGLGLQAGQ